MTEDPQPSAEKDLLKLIENPQELDARKKSAPLPPKTGKAVSPAKSRAAAKKSVNIKAILTDRRNVIKILFAISVFVFINLVINVYVESKKLKTARNFDNFVVADKKIIIKEGEIAKVEEAENQSPLRNIFRPKQKKVEEAKPDPVKKVSDDYKLVGISIDPDPVNSSAMIESVKTNITFFLHKGEKLDGMELVDILEDKLILRVQGQTVELR